MLSPVPGERQGARPAPRPRVITALVLGLAAAPVLQAASLAGLRVLNFAADRPWNYVAYGLAAPYVAAAGARSRRPRPPPPPSGNHARDASVRGRRAGASEPSAVVSRRTRWLSDAPEPGPCYAVRQDDEAGLSGTLSDPRHGGVPGGCHRGVLSGRQCAARSRRGRVPGFGRLVSPVLRLVRHERPRTRRGRSGGPSRARTGARALAPREPLGAPRVSSTRGSLSPSRSPRLSPSASLVVRRLETALRSSVRRTEGGRRAVFHRTTFTGREGVEHGQGARRRCVARRDCRRRRRGERRAAGGGTPGTRFRAEGHGGQADPALAVPRREGGAPEILGHMAFRRAATRCRRWNRRTGNTSREGWRSSR